MVCIYLIHKFMLLALCYVVAERYRDNDSCENFCYSHLTFSIPANLFPFYTTIYLKDNVIYNACQWCVMQMHNSSLHD